MNRMARNVIIAAAACLVLAGAAWFLLKPSSLEPVKETAGNLLADKNWREVSEVFVENETGAYSVKKQGNGYTVHDLPDSVVNMDYVAMLLDECSQISYEEMVEGGAKDLKTYGLDVPASTVTITYDDQSSVQLLLGMEEPVSKGRYAMLAGGSQVVLLKGSRCVRFLMPVEKYVDYIIIEPNESTDVLRSLGDVTFGGSQFPEPVELKAVTADSDEELLRQAVSFGAVTHIITEPVLHEADPTALTTVADSLMGLLSEGVVAYNCTDETLAEYGFDNPLLTITFDYKNQQESGPEQIRLAMSQMEDGTYIVTRDVVSPPHLGSADGVVSPPHSGSAEGEEGIIYKIADVAFTGITYDSLVLRWFLSPLLADVKALEIETEGQLHRIETGGGKPKELTAVMDGQELDPEQYRKFYNLIVSAAADGAILEETPELTGEPVMVIRFLYEDESKQADVMKFYEGPLRKNYVEVNGVCEYTIREKYSSCVQEALAALPKGSNFSQDW